MIRPLISRRQGMGLILLASFLFGVMGFLVKLATVTIPAAQVIFIRSFAGVAWILLPATFQLLNLKFVNIQLLALRGLFGGAAATFYFLSLGTLPLGTAIILNNTAPIFATLYEGLFLRERFTWRTVTALGTSFMGVLFIFHPDVQVFDRGSLYGLLCGILGGGALVSVRKLRETDSAASIFLSFSLASLLFSFPLLFRSLPERVVGAWTPTEWLILGMICIIAAVAQLVFTFASKYVRASEAGIVGMSTVIFATAFGILFLHEQFSFLFILGSFLILGSAFFLLQQLPTQITPRIEPQ